MDKYGYGNCAMVCPWRGHKGREGSCGQGRGGRASERGSARSCFSAGTRAPVSSLLSLLCSVPWGEAVGCTGHSGAGRRRGCGSRRGGVFVSGDASRPGKEPVSRAKLPSGRKTHMLWEVTLLAPGPAPAGEGGGVPAAHCPEEPPARGARGWLQVSPPPPPLSLWPRAACPESGSIPRRSRPRTGTGAGAGRHCGSNGFRPGRSAGKAETRYASGGPHGPGDTRGMRTQHRPDTARAGLRFSRRTGLPKPLLLLWEAPPGTVGSQGTRGLN